MIGIIVVWTNSSRVTFLDEFSGKTSVILRERGEGKKVDRDHN